MLSDTRKQQILDQIKDRIVGNKVVPTDAEILLMIRWASASDFFKKLVEQYSQFGSLFANAFVFVIDAMDEEKRRDTARALGQTIEKLPAVGETITIPVDLAVIKNMKWSKEEVAKYSSMGFIGYVGQTEVFFWGNSPKVLDAKLTEGKRYQIKGVVKTSNPTENKLELIRISQINPL